MYTVQAYMSLLSFKIISPVFSSNKLHLLMVLNDLIFSLGVHVKQMRLDIFKNKRTNLQKTWVSSAQMYASDRGQTRSRFGTMY